jgi:hypothetical protein
MPNLNYSLLDSGDGPEFISVVAGGQDIQSARSDHPNFERIVELARADDISVFDLFDIAKTAASRFDRLSERVTVRNGRVYFDGDEINNALTKQVIRFVDESVEDWKPLVNFFEKVQTNVNPHSREQLYGFIERNQITLTPDGDVVFYKGVKKSEEDNEVIYRPMNSGYGIVDGIEYHDEYLPQKVGSVVEMPREMVKHDPHAACHVGLHAAAYSFARTFGANDCVLELHVNPRDVVSVPDRSNKIRCCRYKIVGEAADAYQTATLAAEAPQEVKDQVDEQAQPAENNKKESTTVPTTTARKRYPKPAQFDDLLARAKRRKQGAEKFIGKLQPTWTFHGGDAKERKNWTTN